MKKNISKKAIKAMAMGIAIGIGSSLAISGAIDKTVVKAYASNLDAVAPGSIDNTRVGVQEGDYIVVNSGLLFKVNSKNNKNTATLVGKISSVGSWGAKTKSSEYPFAGRLVDGKLTVCTNKCYTFDVVEIANNEPGKKINFVDGDVLTNASTLVTEIKEDALRNVTIKGDFSLPAVSHIEDSAFKGATIMGNLNVTINEPSKNLLTSRDASSQLTLGNYVFENAKIKGSFNISSNAKNNIVGNEILKGANIGKDLIIDLRINITDYNQANNVFKNLIVNGNLDLSKFSGDGVDNLSQYGLGNSVDDIPEGLNPTIVNGELKLPSTTTLDKSSLAGIKVGKLDLTKIPLTTPNELSEKTFEKATIKDLNLDSKTNKISSFAFSEANINVTNDTFKNIKELKEGAFKGSNINGDLDFSNDTIMKNAFKDSIINGSLDLSSANLEVSDDNKILENSTINGTLNLSNTTIPTIKDGTTGAVANSKIRDIILAGVNNIPANTFKGSTFENTLIVDATTIGANAFDLTNEATIRLTKYSKDNLATIDANAFGGQNGKKVTLLLPIGTSNEDIKNLKNKLNNKNINFIADTVVVTNNVGTYTFESGVKYNEITLIDFTPSNKSRFARNVDDNTSFINGKLTYNGNTYNLTKIGNDKPLLEITNEALKNNTSYVTTISDNVFKDNKTINEINLPVVTNVGENAFSNTNIIKVDLGSKLSTKVNIPSSAFLGVSTIKEIKTNKESKNVVKTALSKSKSNNIILEVNNNKEIVNEINNSTGANPNSILGNSFTHGTGANIGITSDKITNTNDKAINTQNSQKVGEDKNLSISDIKLPILSDESKVFLDISDKHWAKPYIDKLSKAGIINGNNGEFNPDSKTKRADVTVMLIKLLGLQPETNNKFIDVDSSAYYAPYVGTASTYKVVNGANGMFNPEQAISRQDTMVMIAQILKGLDLNINTDTSVLNKFSDINKISSYANESVAILLNSGIISGNNGKLNPTDNITRAEMATIMSKLYDILINTK
ncbi:S-layer homology domain-containing protein [[Clostridium] colinum]|uniref:S-layer homology domain-containing protein n=1 Tax=[Clostridium] colinum TaxID=36835 RepID=UPI002024EDE6|nr:S-layer homology domain-containing protein [[Clostridium] colinum]